MRFLDRMIHAATEPIVEAGGEIYRYVGDEIIVTWPVRRGDADPRSLACPFAIEEAIARERESWQREYGIVPAFRAALHAGPLVVSELGDVKREIVLLGDVMNTASRILDICRDIGRDVLVSADALAAAALPPQLRMDGIGRPELRGKASGIELFALARGGTA
jgi:adenylate cyclase